MPDYIVRVGEDTERGRRPEPLVRCADCWNLAVSTDGSRYCAHWMRKVPLDGYCHLGERKDEKNER